MTHWRKKGYFERMWWKIRNPSAWLRVLVIDDLTKKRINRKYIAMKMKEHNPDIERYVNGYDDESMPPKTFPFV